MHGDTLCSFVLAGFVGSMIGTWDSMIMLLTSKLTPSVS
jgi:hypothetical protein